jgi:hypothetical protein
VLYSLQWYEYFLVALIVVLLFFPLLYLVRRWERNRDRRIGGPSPDGRWELEQAMHKLQDQFNELRKESERKVHEYEREISTLKSQISMLFERWQATIKQLAIMEQENHKLQTQVATLQAAQPTRIEALPLVPMLVVCGDHGFCEMDTDRINQTGIYYRTLNDSTREGVEDELQRRRLDGNLYWWIHISAHGSRDGVQLADGLADRRFWNRNLEGVRVVFLASCDGPEVGDLLAGVARRVIVFYGDINSEVAALFTLAFWRAKRQTLDADKAFAQAIREVPQARPYVDIRRG